MFVSKDPDASLRLRVERVLLSPIDVPQGEGPSKRPRGAAIAAAQTWKPLADYEAEALNSDVPPANRHLSCANCGFDGRPAEIVVCETFSCDTCYCFGCMKPEMKALPVYQWLCDKCQQKNPCSVCHLFGQGLGEHSQGFLLTCDRCKLQAHARCWRVAEPWRCTSEWLCSSCSCSICAAVSGNGSTFTCEQCEKIYHFVCDGKQHVDVFDQVTCSSCVGAQKAEGGTSVEGDVFPVVEDNHVRGLQLFEHLFDLADQSRDRLKGEPDYRIAMMLLQEMQVSKKHTFLFLALKWYVEKNQSIDRQGWADLMLSLRVAYGVSATDFDLFESTLPRNLNRTLAQLCEPVLRTITVHETSGGFNFQADVHWRDPTDAVTQLYTSNANCGHGPFVPSSHVECNALRTSGARFNWFSQRIRERYPDDGEDVEYLFLRLVSDGSGTNFTQFHPILLSLVNYSTDARALNPETAQVVLGFLPTLTSITCTDDSGKPVSISQASKARSAAKTRLAQKAMRELLLDLARLENGFTMEWAGQRVRARAFLFVYLTDMMERRWLLDLPVSRSWHCSWCYNDNRAGFDVHVNGLSADLSVRSLESTHQIRDLVLKEKLDGDFRFTVSSLSKRFGVRQTDRQHPFFQRGRQIVSSFVQDPSSFFPSDVLHVTEGVILLLVKLLNEGVYSSSLFDVARDLGDTSFSVPNAVAFHKYETRAYNLQFIAAALILGGSRLRAKRGWRHGMSKIASHQRLICAFLRIFAILKDDAPGECVGDLHDAISALGEEYRALQADLALNEDDIVADTCKLHELLEHVTDQVLQFGCARDYGTYLAEWFHPVLKAMLRDSGVHTRDQAKKLLDLNYYRSIFAELRPGLNSRGVGRIEPWSPYDLHVIKAVRNGRGLAWNLEENWQSIAKRVPGIGPIQVDHILTRVYAAVGKDDLLCGNNVECSIKCKTRNVVIKSPISFFVPTQAGRDFKLVSYRMAQEQLEDCGVPGCRHHDANVRLFPAYFRTKQDLHGIPLLYVAGKTQAIAVVLKPAKWDPQFEHDAAVRRFSGPFEVQVVALSRIRDYCLAVVHSSDVYVFRAGSRVFNHLV
jgi:hypothetical protein